MHGRKQHQEEDGDGNAITLQECIRIQKLARAIDELVAWDFVMGEEERILTEVEKVADAAEQGLFQANEALECQSRRCALLPVGLRYKEGDKRRPHANRGEDSEVKRLWQTQGEAFIQQYERHLARYKRLCHDLPEVSAKCTSKDNENPCPGK